MSRNLCTILAVFIGCTTSLVADERTDKALEATKQHMRSFLSADFEKLAETYDATVTLMPGHEFLKPRYGFAADENRAKATVVDRDKFIGKFKELAKDAPKRSAEKIDAMMSELRYVTLEVSPESPSAIPSAPVSTTDGKLHFPISDGDVLIEVSPPVGDFILFHLREKDGAWKVVSEYLD
jgi:hypothetical protein